MAYMECLGIVLFHTYFTRGPHGPRTLPDGSHVGSKEEITTSVLQKPTSGWIVWIPIRRPLFGGIDGDLVATLASRRVPQPPRRRSGERGCDVAEAEAE